MALSRIPLLCLSLCVCLASNARADETEALNKTYCPALAEESSYAKWLNNYKVLVRGKDDRIFRTFTTFKTDFSVSPSTLEILKAFQDRLKSQGTDLVIVFPPTQGGVVEGEFLTSEVLKEFKFDPASAKKSYIDMLSAMRSAGINIAGVTDYPAGKDFFYRRDHHWNPDGAKASALKAADVIKALPAYTTLPKTIFLTNPVGERKYNGSYVKAFVTICKTRPPHQKVMQYETAAAEAETRETALFGDVPEAPVVLVGTSNSDPHRNVSNFEGFLKEALSLDIRNLSVSGAGIDAALLSYLKSAEFRKSPAKIVVWEIPGYYDLDKVLKSVISKAMKEIENKHVSSH